MRRQRGAGRGLLSDPVGNTFPTRGPHVRLDYVIVPGAYEANVRSCTVVTAAAARGAFDHFPLQAELDVDR